MFNPPYIPLKGGGSTPWKLSLHHLISYTIDADALEWRRVGGEWNLNANRPGWIDRNVDAERGASVGKYLPLECHPYRRPVIPRRVHNKTNKISFSIKQKKKEKGGTSPLRVTHYSAHPAMTEWMRNNSVTERRRRVGIIGRSHIPPSSTCSSYRPLCAISLSERIDEWRNVPCGRVSHSVRNQWPAGFPGTLKGEPNRLGRDHGVVCTCEISNKSKSKS